MYTPMPFTESAPAFNRCANFKLCTEMVYLVMEANPREKANMYQSLKFHSEITDDECPFITEHAGELRIILY